MPKIKDIPKIDRPREKLVAKGAENLRDAELLAILLRTGVKGKNAIDVASQILAKYSKKRLSRLKHRDLIKIKGLNAAKACALLAAFELTKRVLEIDDSNLPFICDSESAMAQLTGLRINQKEHFVVLYLNARNQLIHKETISIGTLNANLVHPREVFEPAIKHLAAQIIIAHNHPSGDAQPSEDDMIITNRLVEAGKILGIEIIDHIVVTKNGFASFKEKKLI